LAEADLITEEGEDVGQVVRAYSLYFCRRSAANVVPKHLVPDARRYYDGETLHSQKVAWLSTASFTSPEVKEIMHLDRVQQDTTASTESA